MADAVEPATAVRAMSLDELTAIRVKALAICASTGGPEAIRTVLAGLRGLHVRVPIAITQHLGAEYANDFSAQIEKSCKLPTHLAHDKLVILPGHIYVAGGGKHMCFARQGMQAIVMTDDGAPEHHCKPSANPMLRSMAAQYGSGLVCIMLTGMGDDGIEGVREVVARGGYSIAQDAATSAVWGMPKAVHEAGLAHATLSLTDIATLIVKLAT